MRKQLLTATVTIVGMVAISHLMSSMVTIDDDNNLIAVSMLVMVVGTLFFMHRQTQFARNVAGLQMFMQLSEKYDGDYLRVARNELAPLLLGKYPILPRQSTEALLDFFETLACYTRCKHLDFTLVSNGFSLPIRCYWFTLKNDIVKLRRELQDAQRYAHLEWLNHELEKPLEQRHGKQCILTKEQVSYFLRSETSTRVPNASNLESTNAP